MTFKLTNRLLECYNLLPKNINLLDIGADRGYLAIYYLNNNLNSNVYASENKIGPYNVLIKTIKDNNSNVVPLFGDGLNVYNSNININTISILGMGGKTICKILLNNLKLLDNIKYILVSPQSSKEEVISLLNKIGYKNINGKYIFETRYYPVLLYTKGNEELSDFELRYGKYPCCHKDDNLIKFLYEKKKKYASLIYKHNKNNQIIYNQVLEDLKIIENG